jgi:hypothetical protein
LAALAPDVIVGNGSAAVGPLLQATCALPTVFATVPDPVGAGFVDSLARPGGNATGFTNFEYGIGAKGWNCSKRSRWVRPEWRFPGASFPGRRSPSFRLRAIRRIRVPCAWQTTRVPKRLLSQGRNAGHQHFT